MSALDIEKEREAFELTVLPNGVSKAIRWNGVKYTFSDGGNCMTQDYFDVWLKAKEHAKPVADVFERQMHIGTAWTYQGARGGLTFKTRLAAEQDAVNHGWRLQ